MKTEPNINGKVRPCWLISSTGLADIEKDVLELAIKKNNRQYKLNRRTLENIINGKTNKKAKDAIVLIKGKK